MYFDTFFKSSWQDFNIYYLLLKNISVVLPLACFIILMSEQCGWFSLDVQIELLFNELYLISNHGLWILYVHCNLHFSEVRSLSDHSAWKVCIVEYCRDGHPSGRFFLQHTGYSEWLSGSWLSFLFAQVRSCPKKSLGNSELFPWTFLEQSWDVFLFTIYRFVQRSNLQIVPFTS